MVIVLLVTSIVRESLRANPDCLQTSISAYYYTPVQLVFVGALTVLGFTMIVLWGKSWVEDACFNIAGLLAPVVAFVPTSDTTKCGLISATGKRVKTGTEKQTIIDSSHAAIDNNVFAYLVAVGLTLFALYVVGAVAQSRRAAFGGSPFTFWGPLAAATLLWAFGTCRFNQGGRAWLYEEAHETAAITMFALIVVAIFAVSFTKWKADAKLDRAPGTSRRWAKSYFTVASMMALGAIGIFCWPSAWSTQDFADHHILWVEAWLIAGVATFWILQTVDRWHDGAPLRTRAEIAEREDLEERLALPFTRPGA